MVTGHFYKELFMNLSLSNPVVQSQVASDLSLKQARYDRLHHLRRLQWLSQQEPCWSCGTPVSPYDVYQIKRASKLVLDMPPMAFNHCDIKNSDYVALLDEFALKNAL
jgi:hypothetical protein